MINSTRGTTMLLFFILLSLDAAAQNDLYFQKVKDAERRFVDHKYLESSKCYSEAFQSNGWTGYMQDRLNAARAWAMAGKLDSAYFNLFRIAEKLDYGNLEELKTDKYFQSMRSDPRWLILYDRVEKNSHSYRNKANEGERLLKTGLYAEAAKCYSDAFQSSGWQGNIPDRLNAARAWAMAGVLDSAYFQLFKITEKGNARQGDLSNSEAANLYGRFWEALNTDKYLQSLRSDARWPALYNQAQAKMPSMPELVKTLEKVFEQDQSTRLKSDQVRTQYGANSTEVANHRKLMQTQDSINQVIVIEILEKYGWLGNKEVGDSGNEAIFLVVQHAPLPVQEKYLPMMREAVKAGNAKGSALALLEDRVLMKNGKKQLYGSQVKRDPETNGFYFCAIEDVDNVDQRRALVGLGPLVDYARHFGIIWDAEAIEKNKKLLPGPPEQK